MNGVMEAIREEGRREGLDEGRQEEKSRTAAKMLALGKLPLEEIAEYTGLELDALRVLAEKRPQE